MRPLRRIEKMVVRFGEWSLEKLPRLLWRISLLLTLVIVLVQATMWQTRKTEREAIARELAENGTLIEEMRERLNAIEAEIAMRETMAKVIECESSGRHEGVWGDGGRSYGIAQFQRRTFGYLAEKSGIEGLDWKDRDDQIWLLRWSIDNGYGDLWTCYRKIKG